ncbi:unnamed protein product [Ilex paraguariensis]|uniref:Uncharacterized protein n=1 Tax=Ilex paraguariensis TaxID=185542 RepID=A0ABC8SA79_9AQUA
MFEMLFGWRKASKCKKQIRRVQCRLKLLKNKRCSIVRQLRDDMAELLRHGHDESVFNRVELLFKDESVVAVYDLLDHFCELILVNLSYIRRHKDCPNDINEAVSSLIFASARFGDLPELLVIRKLFGERYGKRFEMTALELLPGNLVNRQIKENLSIKSVPDDVRYRLVDEITRSSFQLGPLALEYSSELQQQLASKSSGDQIPSNELKANCHEIEVSQLQGSIIDDKEGKIIYVDISSESKKLLIEPFSSHQGSDTTGTSTCLSTALHPSRNTMGTSMHKKEGKIEKDTSLSLPYELTLSGQKNIEGWSSCINHTATLAHTIDGMAESSSETSAKFPEEMIYLDDIEEFESPMSKDQNCQDQRLFKFKSSAIPTQEIFEDRHNEASKKQFELWNEKTSSRSYRKSEKDPGKRLRKRSISRERRSASECELYYGGSCENLPNYNHKSHHQRKHQKRVSGEENRESSCARERLVNCCCTKLGNNFSFKEYKPVQMRSCYSCSSKGEMFNNCSLEHPCYFCTDDGKYDWESSPWKTKKRLTTLQACPSDIYYCYCYDRGKPNNPGGEWVLPPHRSRRNYQTDAMLCKNVVHPDYMPKKQSKKLDEEWDADRGDYPANCATPSPWTRKGIQPIYSRGMTMPPERPTESRTDNILRSNSFPIQECSNLSTASSSSRHVHPKLPDYDELQAKFMALKEANLQNKH